MLNKNGAEGVQDEAFGTNKDKYNHKQYYWNNIIIP